MITQSAPNSHNPRRDIALVDQPTPRMLRLIKRLIDGFTADPTRDAGAFLYETAKVVGYQRRAARKLFGVPVFAVEYDSARSILSAEQKSRVPSVEQMRKAILASMTQPDLTGR